MSAGEDKAVLDSNEKYAQQWIDYLKERNARLNIVWPILMVFNIALIGACGYFFVLSQDGASESKFYEFRITELEAALRSTKENESALDQEKIALASENKALAEKLALASTIQLNSSVENEEDAQLVLKLREENEQLAGQVQSLEKDVLAKDESIADLEEQLVTLKSAEENRLHKSTAELIKKIEDSKTAYSALVKRHKATSREISDLATKVSERDAKLSLIIGERDRYKKSLETAMKNESKLKKRFTELEVKFDILTTQLNDIESGSDTQSEVAVVPTRTQENTTSYSTANN